VAPKINTTRPHDFGANTYKKRSVQGEENKLLNAMIHDFKERIILKPKASKLGGRII